MNRNILETVNELAVALMSNGIIIRDHEFAAIITVPRGRLMALLAAIESELPKDSLRPNNHERGFFEIRIETVVGPIIFRQASL